MLPTLSFSDSSPWRGGHAWVSKTTSLVKSARCCFYGPLCIAMLVATNPISTITESHRRLNVHMLTGQSASAILVPKGEGGCPGALCRRFLLVMRVLLLGIATVYCLCRYDGTRTWPLFSPTISPILVAAGGAVVFVHEAFLPEGISRSCLIAPGERLPC